MQVSLNRPVGLMAAPRFGVVDKFLWESSKPQARLTSLIEATLGPLSLEGVKDNRNPSKESLEKSMEKASKTPLHVYFNALEKTFLMLKKEGFPSDALETRGSKYPVIPTVQFGKFLKAVLCRMGNPETPQKEIQAFYDSLRKSQYDYSEIINFTKTFSRDSYTALQKIVPDLCTLFSSSNSWDGNIVDLSLADLLKQRKIELQPKSWIRRLLDRFGK